MNKNETVAISPPVDEVVIPFHTLASVCVKRIMKKYTVDGGGSAFPFLCNHYPKATLCSRIDCPLIQWAMVPGDLF